MKWFPRAIGSSETVPDGARSSRNIIMGRFASASEKADDFSPWN